MEVLFKNILYDNSAKKPSNQAEVEKTKYPGMSALENKIKTSFFGRSIGFNNIYKVDSVEYVIRYRGYSDDTDNNLSWGGVPTECKVYVFAIKENKNRDYSLYITDSEFVKEKLKNRKGNSKSWGISTEDFQQNSIGRLENTSITRINEYIVEIIKNNLEQ